MSETYFKAHGPLLSVGSDSAIYIKRDADDQARIYMRRMEYMTLIEPRQQGKTSLIYHLIEVFSAQDYFFVYADLSIMNKINEAEWYKSIYTILLFKLRQAAFLDHNQEFALPYNGNSWFHFLVDVASRAEKLSKHVVMVLDEAGTMPIDWSTDFFVAIRSAYIQRQDIPCLRFLNFIVAGLFDPRTLIRDPNISTFNINQRVILSDFTLIEVKMLVKHLGLSVKQTTEIAQLIYDWTGGQPALTQFLCKELVGKKILRTSQDLSELVNQAVKRFFMLDRQQISHIRDAVMQETEKSKKYLSRIWHGEKLPFIPASMHIQDRLYLIGIIKESNGNCIIRNRLYKYALDDMFLHMHKDNARFDKEITIAPITNVKVFLSYAQEDEALLNRLREHLMALTRKNLITHWYDRDIRAGEEKEREIKEHLYNANIILLLISAAFIASDYCYGIEMQSALERHQCGETQVIPIILRPVNWKGSPFAHLNVLPTNGVPVTRWHNKDEAYLDIVKGVERATKNLTEP